MLHVRQQKFWWYKIKLSITPIEIILKFKLSTNFSLSEVRIEQKGITFDHDFGYSFSLFYIIDKYNFDCKGFTSHTFVRYIKDNLLESDIL